MVGEERKDNKGGNVVRGIGDKGVRGSQVSSLTRVAREEGG